MTTADEMPTAEEVTTSNRLTDEIIDLLAANEVSAYVATVAILNAFGMTIAYGAKESGRDPVRDCQWWARHLCTVVELNAAAQSAPPVERRH
jgi:hypothetical protein